MDIYAVLDYSIPPCSRANGMFQVIELKDDFGRDITSMVNVGVVYSNLEQLRRELDMAYGMPIPPVEVIEND